MTVYNKTKVLLLLFLMGSCLLHDSIQQNKSVVVVVSHGFVFTA